MRRNLFLAAKCCLTVGCLATAALLLAPPPQASPRFLAAHDARRLARMPETLIAAETPAESFEEIVAPPLAPPERIGHRLAAGDGAAAPLAGLKEETTSRGVEPPAGVSAVRSALPAPLRSAEQLVPEPTPDPVPSPTAALADELRELRREVVRLAQTKAEPPAPPAGDLAGEMRRFMDELRTTERFRSLEEQLRLLQGRGPRDDAGTVAGPTVPPPIPLPPYPATALAEPLVRTVPSPTDADRFNLQVEAADVSQVLNLLGQMAGWNVVSAPGVSGPVTLDLKDVTLEEALEAVLAPRGLVAERKENMLFVLPRIEATKRAADARVIVTKVYTPHYVNVKDLQALVVPLLTPTIGKSAVTSPSTIGLAIDASQGGGDNLAQGDALVVADYPEIIRQVDEIVAEMDVPPMQVVIEAYILRVRLSDSMRFGVNFAILNNTGRQLVTSGSGLTLADSVGFPGQRERLVPPLGEFLAPVTEAGLRYGFLTGDVTGFIEALEGISETSLVASPSLRVLNKQKAELIIGQRLGYRTQTFNNQQTIENVEFLDVGTKLILRPFAAPDGLVRMEIHPERSTGIIDEKGLPQVETTEVTTNVMVRDGATVVVGGLIDEQMEEDVNQVPVLGSIPLLGAVFRTSDEVLTRHELIVLITPRIVCDPIEDARGEALRLESEQRAAYFTDHLSPVSRRNLARLHTERAAELFESGRLIEAHDHARHALSIRKNDGEAQQLKNTIEQSLQARRKRFFSWPGSAPAPVPVGPRMIPPVGPPPVGPPPAPPPLAPSPLPDTTGRAVVPDEPAAPSPTATATETKPEVRAEERVAREAAAR